MQHCDSLSPILSHPILFHCAFFLYSCCLCELSDSIPSTISIFVFINSGAPPAPYSQFIVYSVLSNNCNVPTGQRYGDKLTRRPTTKCTEHGTNRHCRYVRTQHLSILQASDDMHWDTTILIMMSRSAPRSSGGRGRACT